MTSALRFAVLLATWILSNGFVVHQRSALKWVATRNSSMSLQEAASPRMGELTAPEQRVYDLLHDIHESQYKFRVVVMGSGAILETTQRLGPVFKVTQQPSTGANLLTLASEDKSFELHVRLSQVCKMVLTTKETPAKVMRIVRLLNDSGDSLSSLILADDKPEAIEWFEQLISKYGNDIQL